MDHARIGALILALLSASGQGLAQSGYYDAPARSGEPSQYEPQNRPGTQERQEGQQLQQNRQSGPQGPIREDRDYRHNTQASDNGYRSFLQWQRENSNTP